MASSSSGTILQMRRLIPRVEQALVQGPEQGQQSCLCPPVLSSREAAGTELDASSRGRGPELGPVGGRWGWRGEVTGGTEAKISSQADTGKSFPVELPKE